MKKRYLPAAVIIFLMVIPLRAAAQQLFFGKGNAINYRIEEKKEVTQARGIAISNTLFPLATGIAAVELFENNTVQSIGAATAVYGIIMGPSTGNFYANDYGRGLVGLVGRAAGVFLMADAASEIFGSEFADALNVDNREVSLLDTKILIGEVLVVGSALYNILSSKASVSEFNESQGYSMSFSSTVIGNQRFPLLGTRIDF